MKYLPVKALLALTIILACAVPATAQTRIGIVDLRKVFDNYWKTKQADATLKERAADMEKEFKNMVSEFDKSKEDYQKLLSGANDQAVSVEEREKRKKSAEDKLKQLKESEDGINQYRRQATSTLDEQKKRMRDNILNEVRNVLNAKAKTAGFSLVIDTASESANQTPIVLYTNNENDITDDVLKQLNAAAPSDTTKPEPPKSEERKEPKKGK